MLNSNSEEKEETGVAAFTMRWLTTLTVVGVAVGIGLGLFLARIEAHSDTTGLIGLPGKMFVNFFKCIVGPLIFSAMVGISKELGSQLGGPVSRTVVYYYLSSTFVAAFSGILWFNVFKGFYPMFEPEKTPGLVTAAAAQDDLTVAVTIIQFATDVVCPNLTVAFAGLNVIGLIFFGLLFGAMAGRVPGGTLVQDFFATTNLILMTMITCVLPFTPLGVGSLVCSTVAKNSGNLGGAMASMGLLILTALVGYSVHIFGFYSLAYYFKAGRSPLAVLAKMPQLWLTAFGTSSSAATLKFTQGVCHQLGFKEAVINFVTPIGCTVNMDGSAIERTITVLWIGYVTGNPVPLTKQVIVAIIAVAMSIGGAPIPSSGVSTIVLMVEAAGIPYEDGGTVAGLVGLRLGIEWLMDGFNTAVNVTGDVFGTGIADASAPDFNDEAAKKEMLGGAEPAEISPVKSISTQVDTARRATMKNRASQAINNIELLPTSQQAEPSAAMLSPTR